MISDNKKYGLLVSDDKVESLGKFLGMGNAHKSHVWFLGNEEKTMPYEKPGERVTLYRLDNRPRKVINAKLFFTKVHNAIPKNYNALSKNRHPIYSIIENDLKIKIQNCFLGEVYFLPGKKGVVIEEFYTGKKSNKTRHEFYTKSSSLNKMLMERIHCLKEILDDKNTSNKLVIFYGRDTEKRKFLSEIFRRKGFLFNDRILILKYKNHKLISCPFLLKENFDSSTTTDELRRLKGIIQEWKKGN